jgi:phage shock protein E
MAQVKKMLPALVVIALALALGYFTLSKRGDVTRSDAHRLVQAGARLVDVRSPSEFAAGHIDGAVNIPVQELEARLGELTPKDAPLVVYCRSGHRSGNAARILRSAGFHAVHDLGAMSRW